MQAALSLSGDLPERLGTWSIPRGIIRDPLVSFTAVRNLGPLFASRGALQGLPARDLPDQWFGWSLGSVPFVDDFAVPVADEKRMFAHLERSVPATHNDWISDRSLGGWQTATNASTGMVRLIWRGLPLFVPYFGPARDAEQGYIHGGIFPMDHASNAPPAPDELFSQIENRPDLIYYDWEIAPARLLAYERARPFVELVLPRAPARAGTFAVAWLGEIENQLGNVITEISRTAPRELEVTRKSQTGMTAMELWLATRWLDSATFPEFPYSPPKKPDPAGHPSAVPGGPGGARPPR
jgi:hypothetical protein